ncbi:signal peptidase complex subunit SPC1 PWA37_003082 [Arxiozyma heterogenica]|uniref:signal peptidase complex subunit SPC1 n=1 Tax=Arxiozyma heterogenica TaxID=278026 RepID=UPI002F21C61E
MNNFITEKFTLPIDYESQRDTYKRQILLVLVGCLTSCIVGFITQSILQLLICYLCFIFVTCVLILPPYQSYCRRKLQWVEPVEIKISN